MIIEKNRLNKSIAGVSNGQMSPGKSDFKMRRFRDVPSKINTHKRGSASRHTYLQSPEAQENADEFQKTNQVSEPIKKLEPASESELRKQE